MLDMFRSKGLSSVVMGAVIVATVLIFVIQFNPSAGKKAASLSQTCAATVRGYCIEPKDHKAAYLLLVPVDEHGVRLFGRARQMHLPEIALDGLIERELLVSEAERIGLTVSDDEVNDAIISGFLRVSIPANRPELEMTLQAPGGRKYVGYYFRDPKTKEFDEKTYKRNLKNLMDRSPVEFREVEEREILAAKMRDLVRAPVRVSEAEALDSYLAQKSFAVMTYVTVKPAFVLRYAMGTGLSDANLQKQIDAWAEQPENATIIKSTLESRKKEAPIKDGNLRHILVRVGATDSAQAHADALAKITDAYVRLDHGESFAEVARELSDDSSSKSKGGSLETGKSDAFPAGFRAAADALKPGERTHAAIESELGYHIIMRDDSSRLAKDVTRELFFKTRMQQTESDFAAKILGEMKAGKSGDDAVKDVVAGLKPIPFVKVIEDKTIKRTAPAAASKDAGAADATVSTSVDAGAPAPIATSLDPAKDQDRPMALTSSKLRRGGEGLPHVSAEDTAKMLDFALAAKVGQVMPEPLKLDDGGLDLVALKEHNVATREEFDKDRDTYMQTLLRVRQAEALAMYMKRLLDASKADIKRDDAYMAQWTRDAGAPDDEEP